MNKSLIVYGTLVLALSSCSTAEKTIREPARALAYSVQVGDGAEEIQNLLMQTNPPVAMKDGAMTVRSLQCEGGLDLKPTFCSLESKTDEAKILELREPYASIMQIRMNRIKRILVPDGNVFDYKVSEIKCHDQGNCTVVITPVFAKISAN